MPLLGGPADKFGNSYEGLWTVNSMVEIISERALSICIEPLGPEGGGSSSGFSEGLTNANTTRSSGSILHMLLEQYSLVCTHVWQKLSPAFFVHAEKVISFRQRQVATRLCTHQYYTLLFDTRQNAVRILCEHCKYERMCEGSQHRGATKFN